MSITLSLLEERKEYIIAEFGDRVKISEPDEKGFVQMEFDEMSPYDMIKFFHAGFQCGFEYRKKHFNHLV